jgi:hypothetical protein
MPYYLAMQKYNDTQAITAKTECIQGELEFPDLISINGAVEAKD